MLIQEYVTGDWLREELMNANGMEVERRPTWKPNDDADSIWELRSAISDVCS